MIYLNKDITTVERGIIVHGVNCQGVQGAGVAKSIKDKWPQTFKPYYLHCVLNNKNGRNLLGSVVFVEINPNLFVAHVFSQEFYGRKNKKYADINAIKKGLKIVFDDAQRKTLPVFSVKIGCGLGGLDWDTEVKPIYEDMYKKYKDIELFIVEK